MTVPSEPRSVAPEPCRNGQSKEEGSVGGKVDASGKGLPQEEVGRRLKKPLLFRRELEQGFGSARRGSVHGRG